MMSTDIGDDVTDTADEFPNISVDVAYGGDNVTDIGDIRNIGYDFMSKIQEIMS